VARANPIAWHALGAGAAAPRRRPQHQRLRRTQLHPRLRRLRLQAQVGAATKQDAQAIALQGDGAVGARPIVLAAGETGAPDEAIEDP